MNAPRHLIGCVLSLILLYGLQQQQQQQQPPLPSASTAQGVERRGSPHEATGEVEDETFVEPLQAQAILDALD